MNSQITFHPTVVKKGSTKDLALITVCLFFWRDNFHCYLFPSTVEFLFGIDISFSAVHFRLVADGTLRSGVFYAQHRILWLFAATHIKRQPDRDVPVTATVDFSPA